MYYGYFAIDSWHLANGQHFPDVRPTNVYALVSDLIDELMELIKFYDLEDSNHNVIDRKYIEDKFKASKYVLTRIHFDYPREGEITIINRHN